MLAFFYSYIETITLDLFNKACLYYNLSILSPLFTTASFKTVYYIGIYYVLFFILELPL